MPTVGHFRVTINVDDILAPEFEDDDDSNNAEAANSVVAKYIEALSRARFSIKLQILPGYDFGNSNLIFFRIFLDGSEVTGQLFVKDKYDRQTGVAICIDDSYIREAEGRKRLKFRFAELSFRETLPHERPEDFEAQYGALGTISVQAWRENHVGYRKATSKPSSNVKVGGPDAVPEKALKGRGLSIATSLEPDGRLKPLRPKRITTSPDKVPLATFIFKYRSRKALQSLLLIPRSASPVPVETRPVEDLTPDELRELVRRQRARETVKQETQAILKREGGTKVVLKRERAKSTYLTPTRPMKTSRTVGGNDIYHLNSDDDGDDTTISGNISTTTPSAKRKHEIEVVDLLD